MPYKEAPYSQFDDEASVTDIFLFSLPNDDGAGDGAPDDERDPENAGDDLPYVFIPLLSSGDGVSTGLNGSEPVLDTGVPSGFTDAEIASQMVEIDAVH